MVLSGNDDLTVVAGAGAAHCPLLRDAELPSHGETLRGSDFAALRLAIDNITNFFLLAALWICWFLSYCSTHNILASCAAHAISGCVLGLAIIIVV